MIVVKFMGGLGNQMFQYAFMLKKHLLLESNIIGDVMVYKSENPYRKLLLNEAFPKARLYMGDEKQRKIYELYNGSSYKSKIFRVISNRKLPLIMEKQNFVFDETSLEADNVYMLGYWQTEKYWNDIKDTVIEHFEFSKTEDSAVAEMLSRIADSSAISVHVRDTDYRSAKHLPEYGGICEKPYYEKAMSYINSVVNNPVFFIFSDDSIREKEVLDGEKFDIVYVNEELGEHHDWQDMMLMSKCKHNIIANSTFSWWGAYLNKSVDKLIIAPKRWMNDTYSPDICPESWIRI